MNFNSYIVSDTKTAFSLPVSNQRLTIKKSFKQKAFTLAETLITLSIIGVVSAMTVPTLMTQYKEKAEVTRLKKAYTVLSNAAKMAKADGTLEVSYIEKYGSKFIDGSMVLEKIKPGINCSEENANKCFHTEKDIGNGAYIWPIQWYIVAEDGTIYGYHTNSLELNGDTYLGFGAAFIKKDRAAVSGHSWNDGARQYGFFVNMNTGAVLPAGAPPLNDIPNNWHKLEKSDTCPDTYGGCTYWTLKTGKVKKKNGEWFDTIKK